MIKLAEADVSVNALSALRFGIAALCFLPAAMRGVRSRELRWTALELGVWLFGSQHSLSSACLNWVKDGMAIPGNQSESNLLLIKMQVQACAAHHIRFPLLFIFYPLRFIDRVTCQLRSRSL